MSKFATGKWAYGISDRSGFRYRLKDMRKEWNGLLVGKDEWEEKHPQLEPLRVPPDPQAIRNPRPDRKEPLRVDVGGGGFPFRGPNLIAVGQVGFVSVVTIDSGAIVVTGAAGTGSVGSASALGINTFTVTVANSGYGNKYYINGVEQATVTINEGETYRFDQSNNSNSGHPLRLSTTSDGSHGGGSEYTSGVTTNGTPGSSGAYTQITVASGAPTLYYYCTNHSGMGGQANTP